MSIILKKGGGIKIYFYVLFLGLSGYVVAEILLVDESQQAIKSPTIEVDTMGIPHIAWGVRDGCSILKYATVEGGNIYIDILDTIISGNYRISLSLTSLQNPAIAYIDINRSLMYAEFDGVKWDKDSIYHNYYLGEIFMEMDGDFPYIITYNGSAHLLYIMKKISEWKIDSIESYFSTHTEIIDPPIALVVKDGVAQVFYVRKDTTEHPSGDYRIFLRKWDNSWDNEERVVNIDRQYYGIHVDASKDGKIGISTASGYGETGIYHNTYIYKESTSSWNQEYLDPQESVEDYMEHPVISYDTLGDPHIFGVGKSGDTIYHYYKYKDRWYREVIMAIEPSGTNWLPQKSVDCKIDKKNNYHLVFVLKDSKGWHLYYTTGKILGVRERKEVEFGSVVYEDGVVRFRFKNSLNSTLKIIDITGRIVERVKIVNGTGKWKPMDKGVYFILFEPEKAIKKIVVW